VTQAPDFLPNPLLPQTKSEVAVPAIAGGQVIGVFDVQHDVAGYFTEADLDVFRALAGQIAIAFQNAQFVTDLQQRRASLAAQTQALAQLASNPLIYSGDLKAALAEITATAARVLGVARASVWLYDEKRSSIRCEDLFESDKGHSEGLELSAADYPAYFAAMASERLIAATDAHTDAATREFSAGYLTPLGIGAMLDAPILVAGQRVGVVCNEHVGGPRSWQLEEQSFAASLADLVASAMVAQQRRQAEEAIRESQQRLALLVAQTPLAVIEWDLDFRVRGWNPAAEQIFGYTAEEAMGRHAADLMVPEEVRPLVDQVWQALLKQQGGTRSTNDNFTKDGRIISCEWFNAPLVDANGATRGVVSLVMDVTERKRAEVELRRLISAVEQTAEGIALADLTGKLLFVNQAWAAMHGYTTGDELKGQPLSIFHTAEQLQQEVIPFNERVLQTGFQSGEMGHRRQDGSTFPTMMTVSVFKDEVGTPLGLIATARDITEQRNKAEAERERYIQRLSVAAEIAARVQAILDPDELLQAVIPLIKERFGLYYVHVYTLEGEALKLRAGYGEPARIMLERGHSIPLAAEQSLVARAARTQEVVVVDDVTQAPDFLPNPLLPQTKSEVAVPAIAGGQVIGVFDVQHDVAGYFTQEDLNVFQTLAGQIAIAFQNASLYVATEASAARNRALLQTIPDLMFVFDAEGVFLDFKAEAGQELLVPPEIFLGKPVGTVLPPQIAEPTLKHLKQVLATGELVTYEYQVLVGETLRSYEARLSRVGSDQVLALVRDITDRKQAEAALASERDFSNALIIGLPVVFYLYDQAGSLVRWNRRYEEVLGYAPAELSQVKVLDTIAEEDRALIAARIGEMFTTGYAEAEAHLLTKDGRQIPYFVTGTRLVVGDQIYLLGAGIDLTERKRAEAQRERFVTQLRTAAEISAQVGAILDTDELLNEVIPLLKERFNLYHVHFYVMDEARQELVLRAGYGQVGRIMRQQGFKVTLDQEQSLVARAARTRQIVLANDVTQDPDFMPNLLLPDTRAEVAVPAMIGDQLLGVFDVQSDQADYFTESDLDVYRTLTGQIANAFQSARLFEQQRQAEAAQREAAEKIRAMFDAMTEGIIVTNMIGTIEDLNEAMLRLYGYHRREELLGRSSMQLFARPFWSKAAENVRQALEAGASQTTECRMVRHDGSEFEAETSAALLRDMNGAPTGFVSIIRDITARKWAEEERVRMTTQLRTAADISAQATTLLDPQMLLRQVVTLIKERFDLYHVHFYTLDETTHELLLAAGYGEVGKTMLAQGHRLQLEAKKSLVARAARTQTPLLVADTTASPDFILNPLLPETRSEIAVPLVLSGKTLGVLDVQHNRPNHFTEADLDVFRTLAGQLAAALQNARYFEELQHAAERLREMDRMKSEFLANMSHELRTPLNSIIGYAEVMLMGIDGEMAPETLEDIQAIYENGQHLLAMINDILDLAKIESGRMTLKMEPVEVEQLLDEVRSSGLGLLRKYHKENQVELSIEAEANLPLVSGDRIRLNQILNNLLSNAVKFTDHGSIQVRAYRQDDRVCISVKDTGIGIASDQMEKIFEKFQQVDGSARRRAEGTGLGLAITRYLVEMHGGTVSVHSVEKKGSVFTVSLPALSSGEAPKS